MLNFTPNSTAARTEGGTGEDGHIHLSVAAIEKKKKNV